MYLPGYDCITIFLGIGINPISKQGVSMTSKVYLVIREDEFGDSVKIVPETYQIVGFTHSKELAEAAANKLNHTGRDGCGHDIDFSDPYWGDEFCDGDITVWTVEEVDAL